MAALAAGLGLAVVLVSTAGCSTWRGARLYASGTRALEAGDAATAIADLERAVELAPQVSEAHNHLGIAYLQAGRRREARAAFARAVALDCDNRAAAANLQHLELRGAGERLPEGAP